MAVITQDDKLTMEKLDISLKAIDKRLKDKTISNTARKKLTGMKTRYEKQRAKTQNLYKKNVGNANVRSLSATILSVERIYLELGKKANDNKGLNIVMQILRHPENVLGVAGVGLGLASVLSINKGAVGKAVLDGLVAALKVFVGEYGLTAALASWGGLAIVAAVATHKIKKAINERNLEQLKLDEEMNKNTVYNNANLQGTMSADTIEKLANQVATDETMQQYLTDMSLNPNNSPDVRRNAIKVLNEAKTAQIKANKEANAMQIESFFSVDEDGKDALSNYAEIENLKNAYEQEKTKVSVTKEELNTSYHANLISEYDALYSEINSQTDKTLLPDDTTITSRLTGKDSDATHCNDAIVKAKALRDNKKQKLENLENAENAYNSAGGDATFGTKQNVLVDKVNEALGLDDSAGKTKLTYAQIKAKYGTNLDNALKNIKEIEKAMD